MKFGQKSQRPQVDSEHYRMIIFIQFPNRFKQSPVSAKRYYHIHFLHHPADRHVVSFILYAFGNPVVILHLNSLLAQKRYEIFYI